MRLLAIHSTNSRISIALAVLVFQTCALSATTTVVILDNQYTDSTVPGSNVTLTSSDASFTSGRKYAGVFSGTADYDGVGGVAPIATSFFCAELNNAIGFGSFEFTSSTLMAAAFHDGSSIGSGTLLTTEQKCMLMGVYRNLLGITYTANGFVTSASTQDLTGTTTATDAATLLDMTDARAAAAQLVIWEIIHEPVDPLYSNKAPIIGLATGDLKWSAWGTGYVAPWVDIVAEFNLIAPAAYTHAATNCGLVAVPEITSPVALLAGGLVFVRRRERRGSRLQRVAIP